MSRHLACPRCAVAYLRNNSEFVWVVIYEIVMILLNKSRSGLNFILATPTRSDLESPRLTQRPIFFSSRFYNYFCCSFFHGSVWNEKKKTKTVFDWSWALRISAPSEFQCLAPSGSVVESDTRGTFSNRIQLLVLFHQFFVLCAQVNFCEYYELFYTIS